MIDQVDILREELFDSKAQLDASRKECSQIKAEADMAAKSPSNSGHGAAAGGPGSGGSEGISISSPPYVHIW